MNKNNKNFKERMKLQAVIAIVCLVIMMITAGFLKGVATYYLAVREIDVAERAAWRDREWVAGEWIPGWTDENTAAYENAVEEKEALIESNDVARWCFYSAYSTTGKVLRFVTICTALMLYLMSASLICLMLIRNVSLKKKKHNKIKRMHERASTFVRVK